MNCLACEGWATVEKHQRHYGGMLHERVRRCPNGHVFSTYEVPANVINSIGAKRVQHVLTEVQQGRILRRKAIERLQAVRAGLAQGRTAAELADELRITAGHVRRLFREERRAQACRSHDHRPGEGHGVHGASRASAPPPGLDHPTGTGDREVEE